MSPQATHAYSAYPTIEVRGGIFKRISDRVILAAPTDQNVGIEDAREMVDAMRKLIPQGTFRLLLDQRGVKRKIDGPARKYLGEQSAMFDRMAIVTGNAFSRFFASGVLMIIGIDDRARSFDSYDAALRWLQER